MDYKSVLVAIEHDGSHSDVINKALKLVDNDHTKLYLINVSEPIITDVAMTGEFAFPMDIGDERFDSAKNWMDSVSDTFSIERERCYVIEGDIKTEIIDKAEEINADVIVVGSHERHGLSLLFSSTAGSIIDRIKCDLFAVHVI